jgi:hypothetical protein
MRYISLIIIFSLSLPVLAREKRDLLTKTYSEQWLRTALVTDRSWVNYPAYSDRNAWQKIPSSLREGYIKEGEKYLNYGWPQVRATEYLEFTRTGDRQAMERPQGERRGALLSLVIAELMEGKGRFLDDIVNGVFSFCEQTYWGASAHFYMYQEDKGPGDPNPVNLPDIDNPIVDLVVGDIAADLAWIWYYFHDEFDKISPVISRRLKSELQKKVLHPFYERNDYWWITGWKKGWVNNWTPWCNFNVLNCILLLEDDPDKKVKAVYKTMTSVDLFFNAYADDGACDEGPSYWNVAGGKAFDYLNLLHTATNGKIHIFDHPLVKDIGRYIYRVYISQGCYFTNFADAPPKITPRGGTIYRYGQQIADETMKEFGAYLLKSNKFGEKPSVGAIGLLLEDLFQLEGWQQTKANEPLITEYYFPDMQIAIARNQSGSNSGFYFAAKGGSNGEGHNHNDVGSCIVFYDGNPVLVDVGVGTYTKETFTANRYNIWTMQSTYHNVPLINGTPQNPGHMYLAVDPRYALSPSTVSFSADIAGAYPKEAQVEKWVRSYTLKRNKGITISDRFLLKEVKGKTELHFMTPLFCKVVKPGIVRMKGDGFELTMTYNPSELTAKIEQKEIDDKNLQRVWNSELSMLIFEFREKKSGNVRIDLKKSEE